MQEIEQLGDEGSTNAAVEPLAKQPYPGLRSFKPTEAPLFFGRELQARQLRDILANRNLVVVLGGSGSGKSSLVRAGLLPRLNSTAPIPNRLGAWYVVEFRPRRDPSAELFEAIYQQIFYPLLIPSLSGEKRSQAPAGAAVSAQQDRQYAAISEALNIVPPLKAGIDAGSRCKEGLRKALFKNDHIDLGALFRLADEIIATLDEALATGPRSGRANLLLLIDQFEEVFSLAPEKQ
jgi:hypothetical protein